MKKVFLLLASSMMLFALACEPENAKPDDPKDDPKENPDDGKEEKPEEKEKSKECQILTFSVEAGGIEFEGTVYHQENAVVLEAFPDQMDLFKNVTKVTYTISEKATISPDPTSITDYSTSPTLTVTAEDGTTTKRYIVDVEEAMFTMEIAPREGQKDPIAVGTLGIDPDFVKFPGNQVAFVASDYIALSDGNIYDLDLTLKGAINREGIDDALYFSALANDDNNVLIAALVEGTTLSSESITTTIFYAWLDGWDKKPVPFYIKEGLGNFGDYMNVCGDAKGRMLITAAYASGAAVHSWYFDYDETQGKPQTSSDRWSEFAGPEGTGGASSLFGPGAGKSLSAFAPDKDGYFVYAVTRGKLSAVDPNYSEHVANDSQEADHWGHDGGAGPEIVYCQGRDKGGAKGQSLEYDALIHLRGTVYPDYFKVLRHGGFWGWGNLESPANIKAFTLGDNRYVAVGNSGWNSCGYH